MADIKTKESLHTVKFFDRVQNLAMKTREGVEEAKQGIGDTVNSSDNDASDYGANRLQEFEGSLVLQFIDMTEAHGYILLQKAKALNAIS